MKRTYTASAVAHELYTDRENNGYSYDGCRALGSYLTESDDDQGISTELDIVAIRCDWNEYESLEEVAAEYSLDSPDEVADHTEILAHEAGVTILAW